MNSDDKLLQILDNSACLRKGQMIGYLKGSLYPEELRVVELHLSECSLCNDALEGLQLISQPEATIDNISLPELPQPASPERKTGTSGEPSASKRPEIKVNTTERSNPYTTQKLTRRPRNYSWVGGVGIAALLLLGSVLIWQFELRNKSNIPSLAGNNASFPVDSILDSSLSNEKPSATKQIALTESKAVQSASLDSIGVLKQTKPDSLQQVASAAHEGKITASKDSVTASTLPKHMIRDSADHAVAMNEKDGAKQTTANTKADKPTIAATRQQEDPAAPGEISDMETGLRLFKQKKYASALLYLKSAESDNDHPRHWDAVYYSALCNKYLGKTGRAKRLFKKIVNADAPQKSAAEKQLQELADTKE
jgi:hypothetical protein